MYVDFQSFSCQIKKCRSYIAPLLRFMLRLTTYPTLLQPVPVLYSNSHLYSSLQLVLYSVVTRIYTVHSILYHTIFWPLYDVSLYVAVIIIVVCHWYVSVLLWTCLIQGVTVVTLGVLTATTVYGEMSTCCSVIAMSSTLWGTSTTTVECMQMQAI